MPLKIFALLSVALLAVTAPGPSGAATTESTPLPGQRCASQTLGGDHRDIQCPLGPSTAARTFRFRAMFSGGHDDTSARLNATLDGADIACDEGSKSSLFGEDGDVSLDCRFTVPEASGVEPVFGVVLLWSHCQYRGFELLAE